jgi:hypothetical protein
MAFEMVRKILTEHKISELKNVEFENNFENLVQKDLYKRFILETDLSEPNPLAALGKKLSPNDGAYRKMRSDNPEDKNKISFDFLARTIMEIFVEDKVKDMERIYIN